MSKPIEENDQYFLNLIKTDVLEISKDGKVFNKKTQKFLKSFGKDYLRIAMFDKEKQKVRQMLLHRLLCLVFIGPYPKNHITNHKDGNKKNNSLENLEICTYSHNTKHAVETGLLVYSEEWKNAESHAMMGSKNPMAKFNDEQIGTIKHLFHTGAKTIKELCDCYEVSRRTLENIIKGQSYSYTRTEKKFPRKRKLTEEEIQHCWILYKSGTSIRQMGKDLKVHHTTIAYNFKRLKLS